MTASRAKMAETAGRRAELIRRRNKGEAFDDIWPDLGYSSRNHATKDLIRALRSNREDEKAEVSVYRQQELERLDALQSAVWEKALQGDEKAVEVALKISTQRAKLLGLDKPIVDDGTSEARSMLASIGQALTSLVAAEDEAAAAGEDGE